LIIRRTTGILEDETRYLFTSGGHLEVFGGYPNDTWRMKLVMYPDLEVIWLFPKGHLEYETGNVSSSGGYLVVFRGTSGG